LIVRAVAGHDPSRFEEIMAWALRDLFLAYLEMMKQRARETYYLDVMVWAILAPHRKRREKQPDLPRILKGI